MLKELYDDINRRIQDKRTNAEEYLVHRPPTMNLDKFNDKQKEAITTADGPILILAGAGSGKTTKTKADTCSIFFSGVTTSLSHFLCGNFSPPRARSYPWPPTGCPR